MIMRILKDSPTRPLEKFVYILTVVGAVGLLAWFLFFWVYSFGMLFLV